MLRETGEHPVVLRENVTSPAGTTAAALRILEDHKVRAAFLAALEAARNPLGRADRGLRRAGVTARRARPAEGTLSAGGRATCQPPKE